MEKLAHKGNALSQERLAAKLCFAQQATRLRIRTLPLEVRVNERGGYPSSCDPHTHNLPTAVSIASVLRLSPEGFLAFFQHTNTLLAMKPPSPSIEGQAASAARRHPPQPSRMCREGWLPPTVPLSCVSRGETGGQFRGERGPGRARMDRGEGAR